MTIRTMIMARLLRNILTRRLHDRNLKAAVEKVVRGRAIDIGCGTKPYASMLEQFNDEHVEMNPIASHEDLGLATRD